MLCFCTQYDIYLIQIFFLILVGQLLHNVDVVVKSNEIQQDKNGVAELFKTCRDGSVEQAQLLFAPTQ